MRRFDKLKNMKKANLLAEQRYKFMLNESTEMDLMSIITQKIEGFSNEDSDFDDSNFTISLFNDRIEGLIMNGMNIDTIVIDIAGKYDVTSHGYYSPGKSYGPPEDSYPDESEDAEFDIVITSVKIGTVDGSGDVTPIMELQGSDVQRLPKQFLGAVDGKVTEMLLDSGKFDPSDRNDDYDGYDRDDYDPGDTEAREWGGMDI
jgi:hypothetical protein